MVFALSRGDWRGFAAQKFYFVLWNLHFAQVPQHKIKQVSAAGDDGIRRAPQARTGDDGIRQVL